MSSEARSGLYAMYKDQEYTAGRDYETGKIILFSRDAQTVEQGFYEFAEGKFQKTVDRSQVETAYSITTYAKYSGFRFLLDTIEDGYATLVHSGSTREIKHLGFEWVEPLTYEKKVRIEELENIFEEKIPVWDFR